MKIYIKSGSDYQVVNTQNFSDTEELYNEIEKAVKTVYSEENRKASWALCISVGDENLQFGKNRYSMGKIGWFNPSEKVGGDLIYSRFVERAWFDIVNLIFNHFGLFDLESINENEVLDKESEIITTVLPEACVAMTAADKISECMGTILHYTKNADDEHECLINLAISIREKVYRAKKAVSDAINAMSDLTGCSCVHDDFWGCDYPIGEKWSTGDFDEPEQIIERLLESAWECYDGEKDNSEVYNSMIKTAA